MNSEYIRLMVKVTEFTDGLAFESGYWSPLKDAGEVSYPKDGNEVCYQIEDESFWFVARNEMIFELIDMYGIRDEPFVDVGGGNGFVSSFLQSKGLDVLLIEPGIDGVKNAQKRGVKSIVHSSFAGSNFKQDSLSNVGAFDVIEHIEDDTRFVMNIAQSMKPGGKLFLTVPALSVLWSSNDVKAGHYRRYSMNDIVNLAEATNFKVLYGSYVFSYLVLPIFFSRAIPSYMGLINEKNVRKKTLKHHKKSRFDWLIEKLHAWELGRLRSRVKIPFGSSIVVILENRD